MRRLRHTPAGIAAGADIEVEVDIEAAVDIELVVVAVVDIEVAVDIEVVVVAVVDIEVGPGAEAEAGRGRTHSVLETRTLRNWCKILCHLQVVCHNFYRT